MDAFARRGSSASGTSRRGRQGSSSRTRSWSPRHRRRRELEELGVSRGVEDESVHNLLPLAEELARVRALHPEIRAPRLSHERLLARMLHALQTPWFGLFNLLMDNDDVRLAFMALDFMAAVTFGIVHDVLPHGSFDHLDDEEFKHWLKRHGAHQFTLDHAAWIKGYYDLAFAFEQGDPDRPNLAAGVALKDMLRIGFNYKGAMMWKMQAGMGDVVFAPLYEALRAREVAVRFFQRVVDVRLSADKSIVERVRVQPQVKLTNAHKGPLEEYEPLVDVDGLPCWPNAPQWDGVQNHQQVKGSLAAAKTTLEDEKWNSQLPVEELVVGEHFDYVVLATSVDSVREICGELAADDGNPNFGRMLDNAGSVITQAFQLWLTKPLEDLAAAARDGPLPGLGWRSGPDPISSAYVEPLDTCSDMSYLRKREKWQGGKGEPVECIAYFCGPMPEVDGATPQQAKDSAYAYARKHIESYLELFWPNAYDNAGDFDWELLIDPQATRHGPDRLKSQYWRANQAGSERYVTTFAGSVRHRLWPHESGYDNLLLAGDWTRTGIDGGCVEAAVLSGMLAAQEIARRPSPFSSTAIRSTGGDLNGSPALRRVRRAGLLPNAFRLQEHDPGRLLGEGRRAEAGRALPQGLLRAHRRSGRVRRAGRLHHARVGSHRVGGVEVARAGETRGRALERARRRGRAAGVRLGAGGTGQAHERAAPRA